MSQFFFPRFLSTTLKASLCAFILFGCGAVVQAADVPDGDEKIPTDLEFVQGIVADSFQEILEEMPLETTVSVSVVSAPSQENDWIVRDALVRTLLDEKYMLVQVEPEVQAEPDSMDGPSLSDSPSMVQDSVRTAKNQASHTLTFRLIDLRLECEMSGSKLRKHRRTARRGLVDYALRLTDNQDGAVIWARQVSNQREDVVPASYNQSLEVPDAIAREKIEKESHWLEGIAVVGIIASLVYLSF